MERILYVKDINDIIFCPQCGNEEMYIYTDLSKPDNHKHCTKCGIKVRELREKPVEHLVKTDDKPTENEQLAMTLRDQLYWLRSCAYDRSNLALIDRLTDIFNPIIDYIEKH